MKIEITALAGSVTSFVPAMTRELRAYQETGTEHDRKRLLNAVTRLVMLAETLKAEVEKDRGSDAG